MWKAGRFADFASTQTHSRLALRRAIPTSSGAVLWTRLAPRPLEPEGGMPRENVEVSWELAARPGDEKGRSTRRRDRPRRNWRTRSTSKSTASNPIAGTGIAFTRATRRARSAACGRCRPTRLRPRSSEWRSHRASTSSKGSSPPTSKWCGTSSTSCSTSVTTSTNTRASSGAFASTSERRHERSTTTASATRSTRPIPTSSNAHAHCPWVVTPDDHEVENNYADAIAEDKASIPSSFWNGGREPTRPTTR